MTTLNAALNYSFASTESARIASADRGVQDSIAEQIKQASANSPYLIGSTITAKYQYKVAEDGSLIPQQTQITHTAPEDDATTGNNGGRRSRAYQEDKRATLADLQNPKVEMSPTDEVNIFASAEAPAAAPVDVTPPAQSAAVQAEVLDENGQSVEAEIITGHSPAEADAPQDKTSFMSLLAARAQTAAANLYARNSDIIYSATPLASLAA